MAKLARARCLNHPQREAAVRCPKCRSDFCRECAVEHQGRLLCARCLARESEHVRGARRRWVRSGIRVATLIASMLLVWVLFYSLGDLLCRVQDSSHADLMETS